MNEHKQIKISLWVDGNTEAFRELGGGESGSEFARILRDVADQINSADNIWMSGNHAPKLLFDKNDILVGAIEFTVIE